jgi:ABC-type nitrate/sulfonate/bicarbonate transport system permease component
VDRDWHPFARVKYLQNIGKIVAPFALLILLWAAFVKYSDVNPALLPSPQQVNVALREYTFSGDLFTDLAWSLRRAALGLICGGTLGLLAGTLTGRVHTVNWLLTPIFNGLRALPPVAIVPLVVVWAGLGEPAKVFVTSWAAFFPIWLNTHAGVSAVEKLVIWTARSLGADRKRLLFAVTIPAALPQILVGMRLAISTTLICVIVAEMTGAYAGLGYRLQTSYLVFRVDRMMACMIVLAVIGIGSDRLFGFFTRRAFPWLELNQESR